MNVRKANYLMNNVVQDLGFGLRLFIRNSGAMGIAVLTLALGIGANITLFSVINAVLLHTLPFHDPDRLVIIWETHPEIPLVEASYLDYKDWQAQNTSFQEMGAYSFKGYRNLILVHQGEPNQINGALISHNLFSLMGVHPKYGRNFLPEEERPGNDQVVILSDRLWRRCFASDPGIVGKNIEINGSAFRAIGVMSEQDQFPADAEIWFPLSRLTQNDLTNRYYHSVTAVGRLKPGVSEKQVSAELNSIARRLQAAYPATNMNIGIESISLLNQYTGNVRSVLMFLFGAVSLVLLIACINVANLLLARAANREKEIAIRAAHGASRMRIIQQMLTESLLLAILGSVGAVLVVFIGKALINTWSATLSDIPRLDKTGLNLPVLVYTLGVATVTGLLFGILPAVRTSQTNLIETLKQSGRKTGNPTRDRLRDLLIIGEVAIAVIVLISTGLLVRSLGYLVRVDPGFRTDHLLTVQLLLPKTKYSSEESVKMFYQQILEKVRNLPGVNGTASIDILQLVPSRALTRFAVEGGPVPQPGQYPIAQIRAVSPGYFKLMSIAVKSGRVFQDSDLIAPPAFVINESMARLYFRNQDPVGRNILLNVESNRPQTVPIIGVVANVKDLGIDQEPQAELYYPGFKSNGVLLVHSATDPLSLTPAIRREVQTIDPYQPIGLARGMEEVLANSLVRRRFLVGLMGIFSGLALVLSAVGIYGVMSYSVAQRTSEIGLRLALGADRKAIFSLLLRQGLIPVLIGMIVGLIGTQALKSVLSGWLYGISSTDVATNVAVATLVILTAVIAILVPSSRATNVDPLTALRQD